MARRQREQSGALRRRKASSSSPGPAPPQHYAPVVVLHHHHYAGPNPLPFRAGAHGVAAEAVPAPAADTRACSGGESEESASTCTTDLSLGSAGAAVPCFHQSTYSGKSPPRRRCMLLPDGVRARRAEADVRSSAGFDAAPRAAAFAPSARSAFSAPSAARHREAPPSDDKVALPFFDFLGVGAT